MLTWVYFTHGFFHSCVWEVLNQQLFCSSTYALPVSKYLTTNSVDVGMDVGLISWGTMRWRFAFGQRGSINSQVHLMTVEFLKAAIWDDFNDFQPLPWKMMSRRLCGKLKFVWTVEGSIPISTYRDFVATSCNFLFGIFKLNSPKTEFMLHLLSNVFLFLSYFSEHCHWTDHCPCRNLKSRLVLIPTSNQS